MRFTADDHALRLLMADASRLAAAHEPLPCVLRAALDPLDATAAGDALLADTARRVADAWAPALEEYARDTRMLVQALGAVDRAYVTAEMRTAARLGSLAR